MFRAKIGQISLISHFTRFSFRRRRKRKAKKTTERYISSKIDSRQIFSGLTRFSLIFLCTRCSLKIYRQKYTVKGEKTAYNRKTWYLPKKNHRILCKLYANWNSQRCIRVKIWKFLKISSHRFRNWQIYDWSSDIYANSYSYADNAIWTQWNKWNLKRQSSYSLNVTCIILWSF